MEFGEIVWAGILTTNTLGKLDQRWVGKAEGNDEHIGLDHRGARRSRAVRREPESSRWRREVILEVVGCPWEMRPVGHTSPPDASSRVAVWRSWSGENLARLGQLQVQRNCWRRKHRSRTTTGQTQRTHQSLPAGAGCTSPLRW